VNNRIRGVGLAFAVWILTTALSIAPFTRVVLFDYGSAALNATARDVVREVIEEAKSMAVRGDEVHVVVIGHTDQSGSEEYNLQLSIDRAKAVWAALVIAGIPDRSIVTQGRSEIEPAIPTLDGAREAANRRVEIMVY
jgi:outer membrane protein OmpA-like peptidoglycan-associated protein